MFCLASMFTIFKDMRVSRAGRMAGGLVDSKLDDCHLRTTVTPFQVIYFFFIKKNYFCEDNSWQIIQMRVYRNENYPQYHDIYSETYIDEWIEHAQLSGVMSVAHCDQLYCLADSIKW